MRVDVLAFVSVGQQGRGAETSTACSTTCTRGSRSGSQGCHGGSCRQGIPFLHFRSIFPTTFAEVKYLLNSTPCSQFNPLVLFVISHLAKLLVIFLGIMGMLSLTTMNPLTCFACRSSRALPHLHEMDDLFDGCQSVALLSPSQRILVTTWELPLAAAHTRN